jgi:hypothetical protein
MENPVDTLENPPETVTKERKKPNITPEDRAQRAERMRQMATKRNELLKKQKAERFEGQEPKETKPKTPRVKKEKTAAEPAKEPTPEPTVVAPARQEKPKEPKAKKPAVKKPVRVKTLVIQSSSDSEDYCDGNTTCESDDEEVVYIAKKSKSKFEMEKPKAKPQRAAVSVPAVSAPPEPLIRVKFF